MLECVSIYLDLICFFEILIEPVQLNRALHRLDKIPA